MYAQVSHLLLIAIGVTVLASISVAPNLGRRPKIAADGTEMRKPEGSVITEPDTLGYIKKNWFGYGQLRLLQPTQVAVHGVDSAWLSVSRRH